MNGCQCGRCIVIGPTPEQQQKDMLRRLEQSMDDVMKNFRIPFTIKQSKIVSASNG